MENSLGTGASRPPLFSKFEGFSEKSLLCQKILKLKLWVERFGRIRIFKRQLNPWIDMGRSYDFFRGLEHRLPLPRTESY